MGEATLREASQTLCAQAAVFQALLLATSAAHKVARWHRTRSVAQKFANVPVGWTGAASTLIVAAEALAAALLMFASYRLAGALLATAIWSLYLGLIGRAVLGRRRHIDCGCSFGTVSRPLGVYQVGRNTMLAAIAASVAWSSAAGESLAVQASQVLGGLALLALYAALDQVMALQPLRSGEAV